MTRTNIKSCHHSLDMPSHSASEWTVLTVCYMNGDKYAARQAIVPSPVQIESHYWVAGNGKKLFYEIALSFFPEIGTEENYQKTIWHRIKEG